MHHRARPDNSVQFLSPPAVSALLVRIDALESVFCLSDLRLIHALKPAGKLRDLIAEPKQIGVSLLKSERAFGICLGPDGALVCTVHFASVAYPDDVAMKLAC